MTAPDAQDKSVVLAFTALPPDLDTCAFAHALLETRLAACVSLLAGARSFYRWQGQIEDVTETIVLLKTTMERIPLLREKLLSLHPYEVPELLVIPVSDGLPGYLQWIRGEVA